MSGVVHAIGKVFKAVWNFIKPIVKVVAIAAAIYFTAGVALSAFPATAGFAAALPGFAANGVAGAGIFSQAASAIGLGGGLASGAAAVNGAAAAASAATIGGAAAEAGAAGAATVGADAAGVGIASLAPEAVSVAAPTLAAGGGAIAAGAGMSLTDKLLLASVGNNVLAGLTSPSPKDINSLNKTFFGAFYGTNADGSKAPASPTSATPAAQSKPATGATTPQTQVPGVSIPGQVNQQASAYQGSSTAQQSLIPSIAYSGQPVPGQAPDFAVQGATPTLKPQLIPS